jgi:hypothetical protein
MKLGGISYLLLALLLASCGGAAEETVDEGGDGETTSGGDVATNGGETDPLDPCAESDEAPCEEAETDAGDADGGEDGEDGEDGEAGEEGEDGEAAARGTEGGEDGGEDDMTPQERWRAQVRVGRRWFNRRCDTCHPGGEEDIGPNIRGIRWPVARMRRQIRQGSGRMRPIPPARLPNMRMDEVMVYLSTIGAVRGVSRPE